MLWCIQWSTQCLRSQATSSSSGLELTDCLPEKLRHSPPSWLSDFSGFKGHLKVTQVCIPFTASSAEQPLVQMCINGPLENDTHKTKKGLADQSNLKRSTSVVWLAHKVIRYHFYLVNYIKETEFVHCSKHTVWPVKPTMIHLWGQTMTIHLKAQLNTTSITQQLKMKLLVKYTS